MSNPFSVGDRIIIESGMSKKLVGLTGLVIYVDGEWCECELEGRKDYDRVHYSALATLVTCWYCLGDYLLSEFTDDMYCPECDLKRGAETLKGDLDKSYKVEWPEYIKVLGCNGQWVEDKVKFPKFVEKIEKEQFTKGCRTEEKAILPEDAQARKEIPLYSGLMQYFPRALCAVAHQSYLGNLQHNPDKPLHWDRSKSSDEEDALLRHMVDGEWVQVAWRALARLEKELEK